MKMATQSSLDIAWNFWRKWVICWISIMMSYFPQITADALEKSRKMAHGQDWLVRIIIIWNTPSSVAHYIVYVDSTIVLHRHLYYFWNIGDLVNDKIDIAIASLTITSEREEVVDFITPYFDQSGISILGRKPVRPRSLFKFLEVLHVEVR